MILVSVRAFYSAQNTKSPLMINALCSVLIILLSIGLLRLFNHVSMFRYFIESILRVDDTPGVAVLMLPLAYSIGTMLNAWLHWVELRKKYLTSVGDLPRAAFNSVAAAFASGIVTYVSLQLFALVFSLRTFIGVLMQGGISCVLGTLAGAAVLYLLKSQQLLELIAALRKKFWKVDMVTSEDMAVK
jgi:putative peptidoglycan lipid II flippase